MGPHDLVEVWKMVKMVPFWRKAIQVLQAIRSWSINAQRMFVKAHGFFRWWKWEQTAEGEKSLMVKNHCQAFWHLLTLGVFWCCFVYTSMWCGIPWVLQEGSLPFDGFDGFRKFRRYKQSPPVWNCIPYRFTLAESGCWKSSICHPKHVDVCFLVVIESFHFTKCFHQLSFFGVLNVHVFLLQEIFNRIPTGRGIYWISWIF